MVFAQNIVDVAASPETVWSQLVDCVAWPQWYKHCSDVAMLRGGSRLNPESKFRFKTLGLYFEPEIVTFEPHRMLVWSAKGPAGTSGSHAWYIEPSPRGCSRHPRRVTDGPVSFLSGCAHARPASYVARRMASFSKGVRGLVESRRDQTLPIPTPLDAGALITGALE